MLMPDDNDPWFVFTPMGPVPANWKGWTLALIVLVGSTVFGMWVSALHPGQHGFHPW